ncbi:MAG: hypothetical protein COX57_11490 [Alphaproteobacteria bacterium CG_4_10_14_0_2_um_filter_63_37]|nr:MAG: hypothetical protein AUJ55_03150 [Proteobacteria bacterium CG1_02_64_396]PJA23919.1 MAG: hypothetical protein COX57_11490 [Alphaproteobacteria bacterium CG_4_10_14_0_2_um_filter_63_37]
MERWLGWLGLVLLGVSGCAAFPSHALNDTLELPDMDDRREKPSLYIQIVYTIDHKDIKDGPGFELLSQAIVEFSKETGYFSTITLAPEEGAAADLILKFDISSNQEKSYSLLCFVTGATLGLIPCMQKTVWDVHAEVTEQHTHNRERYQATNEINYWFGWLLLPWMPSDFRELSRVGARTMAELFVKIYSDIYQRQLSVWAKQAAN